jgi:hypothetical protein
MSAIVAYVSIRIGSDLLIMQLVTKNSMSFLLISWSLS